MFSPYHVLPHALGPLAVVRTCALISGFKVAYRKAGQTLEEFWDEDRRQGHDWQLMRRLPRPA